VRAFGPRAAAARLEGSKAFMKSFARRHGIPTAACRVFDAARRHEAEAHVRNHPLPVVVKADGLAAGKGVVVAEDTASALAALDAAFEGRLGDAGACVVVEEFLEGEEASLFALCDGIHAIGIGTAQDHKRAFDGDRGPNTGGMGAYSPAPILGGAMTERVMREIVRPTLAGMAAEGTPFSGFLYAGLMIGADGPRLVEFNVRFGDPECQTVLPRLKSDLLGLLTAATRGVLDTQEVAFADDHALTVVAATRGYPGAYEKGSVVGGLPDVLDDPDVMIFHAGTRRDGDLWRAEGGRVFAVTGLGGSLAVARAKAYAALARICWPEGYYRSDIGWRALRRT